MPAMWVGWSKGASKGALLVNWYMDIWRVRAHAKVAPLRIDVGGLEPSSSVVIKTSEATLQPVSYPATWPEGGFAVAQPELHSPLASSMCVAYTSCIVWRSSHLMALPLVRFHSTRFLRSCTAWTFSSSVAETWVLVRASRRA